MHRGRVVSAALCAILLTTGCFGKFALTRRVYEFNETVSADKAVREIVFLALNVVPVYGGVILIDAIFANTVEFFTGENPLAMNGVGGDPNQSARLERDGDGWKFTVRDAQGERSARMVREANGFAAYDHDGHLLGRTVEEGDGFRLVKAD